MQYLSSRKIGWYQSTMDVALLRYNTMMNQCVSRLLLGDWQRFAKLKLYRRLNTMQKFGNTQVRIIYRLLDVLRSLSAGSYSFWNYHEIWILNQFIQNTININDAISAISFLMFGLLFHILYADLISACSKWTEKSLSIVPVTGHNDHKPKGPQPKRPQTETPTNRNGHRPKWPQTGGPQTGTATNRNGHISCHPPLQLSPE